MAGVVAVILRRQGNKVVNQPSNPCARNENESESPRTNEAAQDVVVNAEIAAKTNSFILRSNAITEQQHQAALLIQRRLRIWLHRSKIRLHRKNLGDRLVFEDALLRGFFKLMQQVLSIFPE